MPPISVKVTGKTGVSLLVKFIWPAMEMLGSPLIIKSDTEHAAGVMVNWPLTEPAPELFKVPSRSPAIDMVPPWAPEQGKSGTEIGKLHVWPFAVEVHPPDASGRRSLTAVDSLGRGVLVARAAAGSALPKAWAIA